MNSTTLAPRWITIYSTSAIFLFAALALIVPSGYSIGAVLLLLGGFYAYSQDRATPLHKRDYYLLLLLAIFTLEGIINNLWHNASSSQYDKILRFLLAIPAFYLIRWSKPKINWTWLGLIVGSLGAFLFAFYEKFYLQIDRPSGFHHPIQFGNLSMLMGLFCLAGLGWAAGFPSASTRRLYIPLLLLGAFCGILGSLLSGSRGGWVGLPFVFLVLLKAYHSYFTLRTKLIAIALVFVTGFSIFFTPQLPVKDRIYDALHDVQQYHSGDAYSSVGLRFEMWRGAIELTKKKPLLGWGRDGYLAEMTQLTQSGQLHPAVADFTHAHNEILDKVAKNGVVGLLALLALYLVPIWYFSPYLKHDNLSIRAIAVAGTILSVAYIDFGLSQGFLSHNSGVMIYAFWLVIWAGYLRNTLNSLAQPNSYT